MNPFSWGWTSLRERGLARTVVVGVSVLVDLLFDPTYGTETTGLVGVNFFETRSYNRPHATCYQPTKARPFVKLLAALRLPKDGVFVDLGAGKGRVLCLASRYGFAKVVGVEFCPNLCAKARNNLNLFRRSNEVRSAVDVVESDVVEYRIQDDENVFFMYNPFDSVIIAEVLKNIARSLQQRPRVIWLIYSNPVYKEVLEGSGLFAESRRFDMGGTQFMVYTNQRNTSWGSDLSAA